MYKHDAEREERFLEIGSEIKGFVELLHILHRRARPLKAKR